MKQTTWRMGLYGKVVLTIIAVSLVGLLVRQVPRKVRAKPQYTNARVGVLCTDYTSLRSDLEIRVNYDKEHPLITLDLGDRELARKALERPYTAYKTILQYVLAYQYALGYRVKFVTEDFIILEYE